MPRRCTFLQLHVRAAEGRGRLPSARPSLRRPPSGCLRECRIHNVRPTGTASLTRPGLDASVRPDPLQRSERTANERRARTRLTPRLPEDYGDRRRRRHGRPLRSSGPRPEEGRHAEGAGPGLHAPPRFPVAHRERGAEAAAPGARHQPGARGLAVQRPAAEGAHLDPGRSGRRHHPDGQHLARRVRRGRHRPGRHRTVQRVERQGRRTAGVRPDGDVEGEGSTASG
jgi:hypothetical protein